MHYCSSEEKTCPSLIFMKAKRRKMREGHVLPSDTTLFFLLYSRRVLLTKPYGNQTPSHLSTFDPLCPYFCALTVAKAFIQAPHSIRIMLYLRPPFHRFISSHCCTLALFNAYSNLGLLAAFGLLISNEFPIPKFQHL